jgi:periplasmic divalent cation tolerance protein
MTPLAVFTTVGSLDEARRIAREVVERRLAACAHLSTIESFYVWNGTLQNHAEVRIMFKTTDAAYEALERTIRELHSYELPAIHAVHIDRIRDSSKIRRFRSALERPIRASSRAWIGFSATSGQPPKR